jgi:hypothetical protein
MKSKEIKTSKRSERGFSRRRWTRRGPTTISLWRRILKTKNK